MPGYRCEVHHVAIWTAAEQGWQTRKLANGDAEWIPPPHLDLPGGTNTYHHSEKYLPDP